MEVDLFAGSYELIDAVCEAAKGNPSAPVPVEEVSARVGWRAADVRLGLEALGRAGVLRWDETGDPAGRRVGVTTHGLCLIDPARRRMPPRDD